VKTAFAHSLQIVV